MSEHETQEDFIDPVLELLGHASLGEQPTTVSGQQLKPDYLFFDTEDQIDEIRGDENRSPFDETYAVGDAKKWGRKLDKSTKKNQPQTDHRNPAFQIYNYVDRLRIQWGILTNGKKWRLYSYEDCEADTYYEIDIVETILEVEDQETALQNFKYFYLLFRQEAFLPREDGFVDTVLEGSDNYAKGLEKDLNDKIYTALELTSQGFFNTEANDLKKTDAMVDLVHRSSLIFLYRLLFILNAESRGLLPVENNRYYDHYSLQKLSKVLLEQEDASMFSDDTMLWETRIKKLFDAIDQGAEYGNLQITAYNGGLFKNPDGEEDIPDENKFLAKYGLDGDYLREILELLTHSKDQKTGEEVLVDYEDLNIRHLGSIYEGLLEHDLKAAEERKILENNKWKPVDKASQTFEEADEANKVEKGEVYLTNESGERKATGSYYTPEYIVDYIVENTVGPKVDEQVENADNDVLNQVLDLNICDPAMGSGHFLTEATSYIAHRLMEAEADIPEDVENETVWLKRQVVQRSIYGVDVNPLATELAKLSLWIETMAEGKPLSFLDHHLKIGNSLVGADLDELTFHPDVEQRPETDLSEFNVMIEDVKEGLKAEYRRIEQMDENTVEQVHEKEQAYKQFKEDNPYYQNATEISNLYIYQYFDGEISPEQYSRVRDGIHKLSDFRGEDWFKQAQKDAEHQNYFHWQLEFPKVFFGDETGFDAVVGNPPYVKRSNLPSEDLVAYLSDNYDTAVDNFDLYLLFTELGGKEIMKQDGEFGYILPSKFTSTEVGEGLREFIKENMSIREFVDFDVYQVFEGVTTYTCLLFLNKNKTNSTITYRSVNEDSPEGISTYDVRQTEIKRSMSGVGWDLGPQPIDLENFDRTIGELGDIFTGIETGLNDVLVIEEGHEHFETFQKYEGEIIHKYIKGKLIDRYFYEKDSLLVITPYDEQGNLLPEESLQTDYPEVYEYLLEHKEELEGRENGKMEGEDWYGYVYPKNLNRYQEDRVIWTDIAIEPKVTVDKNQYWHSRTVSSLKPAEDIEPEPIEAIMNSDLFLWYMQKVSNKVRGGYLRFKPQYVEKFPIPEDFEDERLIKNARNRENYTSKLKRINLELMDYLGNYSEGKALKELFQPANNVSATPISQKLEDKDKLQVGTVETERSGESVVLKVSARYKPEDEEEFETDQYGYTETELYPVMEFHDISGMEAALIEEFVPVAVEEAGGFAGFRSNATKTKSLVDRLKQLTLPDLDSVEDDLQRFIDQKEKAESLEQKIEETDEEINEIVYDLYDLTEEEIEVVEEAV